MPTVLVADDNRGFAELLRALLEDAGHNVVTAYSGLALPGLRRPPPDDAAHNVVPASSGPAAIAAVEQTRVDAAVLDVLTPEISGDAVAQRLRQSQPDLPIALMTGSGADFTKGSGL